MSTVHSIVESDDDHKKWVSDSVQLSQANWKAIREYEQQRLKSVKISTKEEMISSDQWLCHFLKERIIPQKIS
ncbi:unnamed protein product [Rotaria sordida]|uniref:Uncharacterized protein n=1 Tax=Rotaria sordida TaxID=392033 RepID=A0A819RVU8_9BILA|nr:unnamed protein product [Rotaria sordida]